MKVIIYTITNWRVSLSKICHEWPNNAVTHECAQRMTELQRYLVMNKSPDTLKKLPVL